ncbi:MAG TPA: helix-turn-helix transcriptional regulator [Hyphomicrobiaceae bacterium]|nr:helix-turn-helix transcriptional regulator [Hyphomicrobiaceae bacterium]
MSDDMEFIRGTGNAFRDLGVKDADLEQLKALLAVEIIRALNKRKLSVRTAEQLTGIAAADFSRVRNAKLSRFTVDRLMRILDRLELEVDVAVSVRKRAAPGRSLRQSLSAPETRDLHEPVR